MVRWLLLCAVAVAFAASQVRAEGGSLHAEATGLSGVYTEQVRLSDHPHHVLVGHVIVVQRGPETVRALVVHHRRDGVHRLRYREAWSGGVALPYRSFAHRGRGCTHGHCRDNQVGMIFLSRALFAQAQEHGLVARLTGPSGTIDLRAPATLFQEAARRAAEARI